MDIKFVMISLSLITLLIALGWCLYILKYSAIKTRLEADNQLLQQQVASLQVVQSQYQQALSKIEILQQQQLELHRVYAAAQEKLQQQEGWQLQLKQQEQELRTLREQNSQQQVKLQQASTRLEAAEEKQQLLISSEQRLVEQFENLANRIFEQSGKKVDEQNKHSLLALLNPLRDKIDNFSKQVQDRFGEEAKERHTLTFEIRNLKQLNEQMTRETVNLTRALKGDNKTQGNWGEVILSRVLEASGLREGYEYHTQVNLPNEQGNRLQPDMIVHLPQEKDVIIDAKMSLIAYERYFNSEDEQQKQQALNEHLLSLRNHIRLLSKKEYHNLTTLRSLDYVLMFIPVEPAFLLAIEREPDLVNEALKHNIMLVSPTTLLVALRTISNLWRYEYQSQNAKQIADKAAKLYDKLRGFIENMESLGLSLNKANETYHTAMKQLCSGRGNLINQVEHFRSLGVEVKKPISPALVKQAADDDPSLEAAD